jgi:hypothetical protein
LRLELQSDNGDAQIVVRNGAFSIYDPSSNTAYEGTLPSDGHSSAGTSDDGLPTLAQIETELTQLAGHVNLSGAIPSDVAGQAAYTVRVSPKHDGGLLGAAEIAWDAARGVPLRFAIYASDSSSPVLELKATEISFGPVVSSVFNVSPPPGTSIVKVATPAGQHQARTVHAGRRKGKGARGQAQVSGVAAVARHLPFTLIAPATLPKVGLTRRSVTLLDWDHSPAALVTYGENLGGIAVIEQTADAHAAGAAASSNQGSGQSGLSLPTVSINGITAQELDTALFTMIRFTRAGVTYTVLGSVPPVAAELAAKAL